MSRARSNGWLAQLEQDRGRAAKALPMPAPAHAIERDLRRPVEVRALQDGEVRLMRMSREDFERCLREYRHLPWRVLEARIAAGGRGGGEGR